MFKKLVSFLSFLFVVLPLEALAQSPTTYQLMAPLGPLAGNVTLTGYLQGVFQVVIGTAGVLAVVMIVWCGIKLMGTPSVSQKSEAKDCIANAIFGVLLAAGGWIILNTINSQLIVNGLDVGDTTLVDTVVTSGGANEKTPTNPGWYYQYRDANNRIRYNGPFAQAACNELQVKASNDRTLTSVTECFEVRVLGTPPVIPGATPAPATTGVNCIMSGANLCQPHMWRPGGTCTNPNCTSVFSGPAATYATGAATVNLIKAVIWQESSCNTGAVGPSTKYGQACGPMQMLPSTANSLRSLCSITETIDCSWLTSPRNTDKAICLGAKYLNQIAGSCTGGVRDIAAGYNSGPGNCAGSTSCGGDTNCAGNRPPKRWECLYDDPGHNVCNAGFNETRRYATQVLYCTNNPGF